MNGHPHSIASEEELLPRIAAGDQDAFAALFRRHSGEVFRFALHMTGSRALADDVTQEVFLAVMRDADRYVPGLSSEIAWLRGIARNHVRRRLDSERITVALPADGEDDCPAAREAAALCELVRAEQIESVRAAVASLPVRYREVVVLCDLQELSYADTAVVVGCAVGTVRSRLFRARALLASKLRLTRESNGEPAGVEKKVQARWAT
jgi:RNA polymerase sigma-70 factor (ECF subfamily)